MADDNSNADAQAAAAGQSQADTSTTTQQPPAGTATTQAAGALSLDEARKLRKEHQQLRKERDEFAAKLKAADDAKLSETERLTKERDELAKERDTWAAERRERDARDAVIEAASGEKVGARNPHVVYKLVKDDLEFDEKGQITNLAAVLKEAKAEYPELFGRAAGSGDGGAGSRQQAGALDMNAEIRRRMHGG